MITIGQNADGTFWAFRTTWLDGTFWLLDNLSEAEAKKLAQNA